MTTNKTAGVTLQGLDLASVVDHAELLERVLRKVKAGQMPPAGTASSECGAQRSSASGWRPRSTPRRPRIRIPGAPAIHRLNRAEYSNAIRDILDLDINAGSQLPVDDSGYGFDNIGDVLSLSPALLDRYLSVGRKIARLAVGDPTMKPVEEAFEPRRETGGQRPVPSRPEWMSDDLPFNSAGGVSVRYYFPLDAEYVLRVNFGNGPPVKSVEMRLPMKAGLRTVGVTFPRESLRPEILPMAGRGARPETASHCGGSAG